MLQRLFGSVKPTVTNNNNQQTQATPVAPPTAGPAVYYSTGYVPVATYQPVMYPVAYNAGQNPAHLPTAFARPACPTGGAIGATNPSTYCPTHLPPLPPATGYNTAPTAPPAYSPEYTNALNGQTTLPHLPGSAPLPSAPPMSPRRVNHSSSQAPSLGSKASSGSDARRPVFKAAEQEALKRTSPTPSDIDTVFSLARHGRFKEVAAALDAGRIAPSTQDKLGNTVLHIAAQNGFAGNGKRVVKAILRRASLADLNAVNNEGQTPLHFAYAFNYRDCAEYLVSKGASKDVLNRHGLRPTEGLRR